MLLSVNVPTPQPIPGKHDNNPTPVYFVIRAAACPDGPDGRDYKTPDVNHLMCYHDLDAALQCAYNSSSCQGKNEVEFQYFVCQAISVVRRNASVVQPVLQEKKA